MLALLLAPGRGDPGVGAAEALWWIFIAVGCVVNIVCFVLLVMWMLRIMRAAERTAKASEETREFVRQVGVEVASVTRPEPPQSSSTPQKPRSRASHSPLNG
ncbi:MAG TPA: hypothetical protein VFG69_01620 [Nannocystaceae bacterium]|nr:hypothetical protein [Nannocystaceae bacterium]